MIELGKSIELSELIEDLSTDKRLQQFDAMLIGGDQVECPLDEQFVDGLYIRERFVPAGTLFSTYTWRQDNLYRCIQGELLIWEKEKGWQLMEAPAKGITKAGTKRIVYAITDVIFETLHPNVSNTQDPQELHDMLFEPYDNKYVNQPQLTAINTRSKKQKNILS